MFPCSQEKLRDAHGLGGKGRMAATDLPLTGSDSRQVREEERKCLSDRDFVTQRHSQTAQQ